MAKNEFKLSYTAEDINNKLGKVEEHSEEIAELTKDIDNLSIFVTPQMFGAVGDGNTDDTNAIQAAFDADQPIVYFPPGRYKTTRKLVCQKPKTIKMCRQYPCDYQKDHPYNNSEDWIGARIETSSPNIGIVIGDGVCLDGFSVRAMPGFGGWDIIDYNTGMENNQNLIALEGTSGKGIVLQYDGTLGTSTYPSQVRFSHVRVDIAPLLQNETSSIVSKNVYIIPECLFEFRPVASHNYIFEDIFLGQRHNRYCDNAFRTVIEQKYYRSILLGEVGTHIFDKSINEYRKIMGSEIGTHILININDPWCNNVYVKNMCIEARCDYGINIINNHSHKKYNSGSQGHTAYGWVFEELNIQAFDYIHKSYAGPLKYNGDWSQWTRHNNPLNRKHHKSLIKINGMEDLTFMGCCLHDVVQYNVEQGFSEGIFNIDGQAIHRITEANSYENIVSITAQEYYDKDKENYIIQNIVCVGCSQEFDRIETYLSGKIKQIEIQIEDAKNSASIAGWSSEVKSEEQDGQSGQTLILRDSGLNELSSFIPSTPISEEMINKAVSAWMDEATKPETKRTNNAFNKANTTTLSHSGSSKTEVYYNTNINSHLQCWWKPENNPNTGPLLAFDRNKELWTTHYIKASHGNYIGIYNFDSNNENLGLYQRAYTIHYFSCPLGEPTGDDNYIGCEDIPTVASPFQIKRRDGQKIKIDNQNVVEISKSLSEENSEIVNAKLQSITHIKLVFMPFNLNSGNKERSQPLWPGDKKDMSYPSGVNPDNIEAENLMITVSDKYSTAIPSYEEYEITTIKLSGLLPAVTQADNGKILQVVDGKWTAVSYPTCTTV